ncbi:MAG: hypothetical protein IT328_24460 [Caldilineaceae bacterium]|nr:hypothetical protein [Caldilineaceae bacterium]
MLSMIALALVFGVFLRATLLLAAPVEADLAQSVPQEADHGGDDDHGDLVSRHGILESRPDGITGTWVIDGKSYTATESTVLDDERGALEPGICVEVKALKSDPTTAVKIESKEAFKCDDDGDHDDDIKRYGILESRADGITGTWVIGGKSYTVTERTKLDEDHGALVAGVCVKVEVRESEPTVARELESEHEYKCSGRGNGDDDRAEGKLFGLVMKLPADLSNGIWTIGTMTFVVSSMTNLVSKGAVFTEGVTVKVDFVTDSDNINYARKIEIKFGRGHLCWQHNRDDDHGDDDGVRVASDNHDDHGNHGKHGRHKDHGRYGYCPGAEGKTYGLIEIRPSDALTGEWQIGGVIYLADDATRFYATDDLQVGERVKVEYVVDADGNRIATKIQESLEDGGLHDPNNSKLVGFVDEKPTAFIGEWMISGVPFVAVTETIFLERAGVFEVGSYVVVEYSITGDQRVIYEIRTHVPPGAGDSDTVGKLESIGGVQAAGALPTAASAVWTVSGVDYVVTEATQIVDSGGDLVAGKDVAVNSYSEDGQQIATSIRLMDGRLFIPAAAR